MDNVTFFDQTGQLYAKIHLCRERRRSLVKQYLDMLIPMCPKITTGLATKFSLKIDSQKVEIFEQKLKAADHHVKALWLRFEELQEQMRRSADTEWSRARGFVGLDACKQNSINFEELDGNRMEVMETQFASQSGIDEHTRLPEADRIDELKRTPEETKQDLNRLKSDDTNPVTGTAFVLPNRGQQSTESKHEESKNQLDAPERCCPTSCQRNTSVKTAFQIDDTTTTLAYEKPFFVTKETTPLLVNKDTTTEKNSENVSFKNQTTVQIKVTEYQEYLLRAAPFGPDTMYSSGEQTDELELGEAIEQRKPTDERGVVSNLVPSDFSQMRPMQNTASVPSAAQKSDSDEDSFYD